MGKYNILYIDKDELPGKAWIKNKRHVKEIVVYTLVSQATFEKLMSTFSPILLNLSSNRMITDLSCLKEKKVRKLWLPMRSQAYDIPLSVTHLFVTIGTTPLLQEQHVLEFIEGYGIYHYPAHTIVELSLVSFSQPSPICKCVENLTFTCMDLNLDLFKESGLHTMTVNCANVFGEIPPSLHTLSITAENLWSLEGAISRSNLIYFDSGCINKRALKKTNITEGHEHFARGTMIWYKSSFSRSNWNRWVSLGELCS